MTDERRGHADLIGTPKPPCLYPLPDGRRCCECASCHPTEDEQRAWIESGRVPDQTETP